MGALTVYPHEQIKTDLLAAIKDGTHKNINSFLVALCEAHPDWNHGSIEKYARENQWYEAVEEARQRRELELQAEISDKRLAALLADRKNITDARRKAIGIVKARLKKTYKDEDGKPVEIPTGELRALVSTMNQLS